MLTAVFGEVAGLKEPVGPIGLPRARQAQSLRSCAAVGRVDGVAACVALGAGLVAGRRPQAGSEGQPR